VLPITSQTLNVEPIDKQNIETDNEDELNGLKESLRDTQPVSALVNCCKTVDQVSRFNGRNVMIIILKSRNETFFHFKAKAVLKFIDAISEKTLRSTVSLTASRGRGKSAALGLAVAGAVAFGYSNIFVSSPSPENLKTFFEFVFIGKKITVLM
jgi:N-acetyltransferase 10